MVRNPVMFVVLIGSVLTTLVLLRDVVATAGHTGVHAAAHDLALVHGPLRQFRRGDGRGAGQGPGRHATEGADPGAGEAIPSAGSQSRGDHACPRSSLRKGDLVLVMPGDLIPGDGEVVEGVASVDESAITGESAPVIRESGGDRSAVTGGTRVLSDYLVIRITANPGETFLDRMIALVEGAERQKTPNEIALTILLSGLTIVFLLGGRRRYSRSRSTAGRRSGFRFWSRCSSVSFPTTIGGLLSAIGIAGMDRVIQQNVIAMSGRSVEAAGDVNTLLLDKTGTITLGNRQAVEFVPVSGVTAEYLADRAQLASLAGRNAGRTKHRRPRQGDNSACADGRSANRSGRGGRTGRAWRSPHRRWSSCRSPRRRA